ncbi:DUF2946 family protein [Massilia cavernae]|uniref:DUF2946 family protein n=1 Tax=Massilia cavernae TaxID=2320864 RepID=A0A418XRV5_9BURK|nr:DUF2946 family protein [Massilia cavernae]RJG15242.1 DUF2946 family protein [Massilia cavernae]
MDDIVKQAIAKWPNVPHCYGWLALDARGAWRMRDERAQQLNLPGDKLNQPALLGFINRNYAADERGCWYFQNGPQRVYLNLEATPFIARTDPLQGLVVQTGEPLGTIERAALTEAGELILASDGKVAQLDDRDMTQLMDAMEIDGHRASDDALMAWLEGGAGKLTLRTGGAEVAVERVHRDEVNATFGFQRIPHP